MLITFSKEHCTQIPSLSREANKHLFFIHQPVSNRAASVAASSASMGSFERWEYSLTQVERSGEMDGSIHKTLAMQACDVNLRVPVTV